MDAGWVGWFFEGGLPNRRWRRVPLTERRVFGVLSGLGTLAVETFLVPFPLGRLIVFSAPLVGTLATMVLPAAERAAEIPAIRVAGMREEANPAVTAAYRAVPQRRMLPQDGVQGQLILTNERLGAVVLVPILAKSKNFRDGYSKRDRLSVKMLIVLCISSSYSLDANASRGRARIFCAIEPSTHATDPHKRSITTSHPDPAGLNNPHTSPDCPNFTKPLLGKKETPHPLHSSFQVVGQLIRAHTGQLGEAASTLSVVPEKDLRQVLFIPATAAAAHRDALFVTDLFE